MEVWFLLLLFLAMIGALSSGFPVAFALPGSAILTIAVAALAGWLFAGDVDAFFVNGGPTQWLSAGITNLRSLYWVVERDTLIAIPLFVFMGIMLQRSRIAEDLLLAMAKLFGPVPGGLGISVVFVGALLAATTGIVGATVIAMGLISLPAMLRNNYSPSLASGTICASGTLGQIIPPSIVLIILADQLANAADQANTARKAEYRASTGEYSMPGEFDVVSASAGDMFMGALVPGLVLVGLYMVFILVRAVADPRQAPPVPYEGNYDRRFVVGLLLALVPPLVLIFIVLGSILLGVATVNQAGAIGAIGALLMGSYRLGQTGRTRYLPAALAVVAVMVLALLQNGFDLNIRHIRSERDLLAIAIAVLAVGILLYAVGWAIVRAYRSDNVLGDVMRETARTTSMVFIILLGAAMLTSAFRAFGGEELVKDYLTSLPGGFWVQFAVVMGVIFLLGFFLDFIEIAVVVVPIVAPILLADPSANVTAVWLGVMVGLNIQTSFLTPPFGFALFYLRGVAPAVVQTLQIYKGAFTFIALQLLALAITAVFPLLINYLPNRAYLTSATAPPPDNPRLQYCLEQALLPAYREKQPEIERALATVLKLDRSILPSPASERLTRGFRDLNEVFAALEAIEQAVASEAALRDQYAALHRRVRPLQASMRRIDQQVKQLEQRIRDLEYASDRDPGAIARLRAEIEGLREEKTRIGGDIPQHWQSMRDQYRERVIQEKNARNRYRRLVDDGYQAVTDTLAAIRAGAQLENLRTAIEALHATIRERAIEPAMEEIKRVESALSEIADANPVKSPLARARRVLQREQDRDQAMAHWLKAQQQLQQEIDWRQRATTQLLPGLLAFEAAIRDSIGVRQQPRLSEQLAKSVAACEARHRDISLHF